MPGAVRDYGARNQPDHKAGNGEGGNLEAGCKEAFKQIEETGYEERLKEDGMTRII